MSILKRPLQLLARATGVGVPLAAMGVYFWVTSAGQPATWMLLLVVAALALCVLQAVHHAEVVAHRVGEPFGTLVLALAVTVIETALIVSLMLSNPAQTAALARDTVYAAIMIVCNFVVGMSVLAGCWRVVGGSRVLRFRVDGAAPVLSVLACLAVLVLVLPSYTTTVRGPVYSASQLWFAAGVSLALYLLFVFVQTVAHRDYFLPVDAADAKTGQALHEPEHAAPPSLGKTGFSLGLLLACLVAVVALAKTLAGPMQTALRDFGLPAAFAGVIIALLVLAPETLAAVRAAAKQRMQTSLNLALGSALATIGLTIPTVVLVSQALGLKLVLGLGEKDVVLLALTLLICTITLSRGLVTILHAGVHLALFAVYLFLTLVP